MVSKSVAGHRESLARIVRAVSTKCVEFWYWITAPPWRAAFDRQTDGPSCNPTLGRAPWVFAPETLCILRKTREPTVCRRLIPRLGFSSPQWIGYSCIQTRHPWPIPKPISARSLVRCDVFVMTSLQSCCVTWFRDWFGVRTNSNAGYPTRTPLFHSGETMKTLRCKQHS